MKNSMIRIILLMCFFTIIATSCLTAQYNLNGYWSANDGGHYYIRQDGNMLYWFGEDPNGGWANVFKGQIAGNTQSAIFGGRPITIHGQYYDVPKGRFAGRGELKLSVKSGSVIEKVSGSFGGSKWTKQSLPRQLPGDRPEGFSQNALDGRWECNDGGKYYIRQVGTTVVWFGEKVNPSGPAHFANVGFGSRHGHDITLDWFDVPKCGMTGKGQLKLRVNGNRIDKIGGGGFGGSKWTRPVTSSAVAVPSLRSFGHQKMTMSGAFKRDVSLNVVLVLATFQDTRFESGQTPDYYEDRLFKGPHSIKKYLEENSNNMRFMVNHVRTIKVQHPKPLSCAHRWERCTVGNDGRPYEDSFSELLEQVPASEIRFINNYDSNRDGEINHDELFFLFISALPPKGELNPFSDYGGRLVGFTKEARPQGTSKKIIGSLLQVGDKTNMITIHHEILHAYGADDIYGGGSNSGVSTMAGTTVLREFFCHLDPWHKMRLGYHDPVIKAFSEAALPQTLKLYNPVIKNRYKPVIFYHPDRGTKEYFMIEYRRRQADTMESDIPDSGLYIWYVNTDSNNNPIKMETLNPDFPEGLAVKTIGAPDYAYGNTRAWKMTDGHIRLKWGDGSDSNLRLKIDRVTDNSLNVKWWVK